MKKRITIWVLINLLLIALAATYMFIILINRQLGLSQCGFNKLTGLYCLSCGGTRAVESLMQFRIADAFRYNPFVPLGIILFLYYDIRLLFFMKIGTLRGYFKWRDIPILVLFIIAAILYFIVRNVLVLCGIDILLL